MILLIDNYDSFSYNLVQLIGKLLKETGEEIRVIRNDAMTVAEIEAANPRAIILSPGPGRPCDAGVCEDVIRELSEKIPMLGICLGHQAICETFGGVVSYAKKLMHGKMSVVTLDTQSQLFKGLDERTEVARYHSLSAVPDKLPDCLKVIATSDDGEIMAVEHKDYPVYGVQFHPESILTPRGIEILKNFLSITI